MKFLSAAIAVAGLALAASPVEARRALVTVDGRSMPWDPGLNPKRSFGQFDGKRPVYVWGLPLTPGASLSFSATGQVTVLASRPLPNGSQGSMPSAASSDQDGMNANSAAASNPSGLLSLRSRPFGIGNVAQPGAWGPSGQPFRPADRNVGGFGAVFPSYHISGKAYPVNINALVGSFIDADGAIVGEPFKIGDYKIVEVPVGAVAIALGVNAETYAYNRGAFQVVINTRVPKVTVETSPDNPSQP